MGWLPDTSLGSYIEGFDPEARGVRLEKPVDFMRARDVDDALRSLAEFVPADALTKLPEDQLDALIDRVLIPPLRQYCRVFEPAVETPEEWPCLVDMLATDWSVCLPLVEWTIAPHRFTPATRMMLLANFADTTRSKPVLLVLMSPRDWCNAFLQQDNLKDVVYGARSLGLIVQGRTMADATAKVDRVAKQYGMNGRLGQVVIGGHGSDSSQEIAADGGNIDVAHDPKGNGTEALIDTILNDLDPATANLVFAGCLLNSHEFDVDLRGLEGKPAQIVAKLRAHMAAHPNVVDYVRSRMAATGRSSDIVAANAPIEFQAMQVAPDTGKVGLRNPKDPFIAGSKLDFFSTGGHPEAVLRASIECCANPQIGIAATTLVIRQRIAMTARSPDYWRTCVRVAFELALPASPDGDVDVAKLVDLSPRTATWSGIHARLSADVIANSVHADEAAKVFGAITALQGIGKDVDPDFDNVLHAAAYQAWTKYVPSRATQMMEALSASHLDVPTFEQQLSLAIVTPLLAALLPVTSAPTRGQMLLALAVADLEEPVPTPVRDFLRAVAGGPAARAFPDGLDVATLLPIGVDRVLQRIGLSDVTAPVHVDLDRAATTETRWTRVGIAHDEVIAHVAIVRDGPDDQANVIGRVRKGGKVHVVAGVGDDARTITWVMIDFDGKVGYVRWSSLRY
jgi:hypothetical protein